MGTETVKACPHGHINVFRRSGGETVRGAESEADYYCKTCSRSDYKERQNPFHDKMDMIEVERKTVEGREYDVSLGYVWSPSHEEGYPDE